MTKNVISPICTKNEAGIQLNNEQTIKKTMY